MNPIRTRRRLAAQQCFEAYLSAEQLQIALETLERSFQIDGIVYQINYIKTICKQFGLGEATAKNLQVTFYQLMQSPLEKSQADTPPPLAPPAISNPRPIKAVVTKPANEAVEANTSNINVPAHAFIFGLLVHQVINETNQTDELFNLMAGILLTDKQWDNSLIALVKQWQTKPSQYQWTINQVPDTLAKLVNLTYIAVCELEGPVEADRIFHKALAASEKHPAARHFLPSALL